MPRLDPVERMLCFMILSLTVLDVSCAYFLPNDGQTFQLIANMLTTFTGALIGRITKFAAVVPPPGTETRTETVTVAQLSSPPIDIKK